MRRSSCSLELEVADQHICSGRHVQRAVWPDPGVTPVQRRATVAAAQRRQLGTGTRRAKCSSVPRPRPSTASASGPCCANSMPPPRPCSTHRPDRMRPAFSLHGPPRLSSPWNPRCSELCCCVDFACHSRSLQRDAGVANRMMPSVITLPLAHGLVCCARVGAHLSERRPGYAGRRVLLSRCMP